MTYLFKQYSNPKYQHGFSLLEVMIAMVILSVGLLGLAGMQVIALENSNESASRNQAIILAYSMYDRMMSNQQAKDSYLIASTVTLPVNNSCTLGNCVPTGMVTYDHSQWKLNLSQQLLSGSGEITGAFPDYTITVRWDEDRNGATGLNCPPQGVADLRCFQLMVQL
ncbi:MAG: type IV pilus modification protein PilV [Gammaproteobacteria bacterium]